MNNFTIINVRNYLIVIFLMSIFAISSSMASASHALGYKGKFSSFVMSHAGDPREKSLKISFNSEETELYYLKLHDMTGNEVSSFEIKAKSGDNDFIMDVSTLKKGTYFISLQNRDQVLTKRLVIR